MSIMLYNTLTRQKETFVPIEEGKVKIYVCGPTVYNYIHIGNARPAIVFDTVRRYFEYQKYQVDYVLNFTDVDDKIIKAANQLGEEVPMVAERFIASYKKDVGALGVKEAVHHPRVTENMQEIIEFIDILIKKEYAYESDGDVYYRTRSFEGYGKLSHQSIDELRAGSRIEVGEKKDDPLDFALWKQAKPGEISWDSPWGKGRPGWHIECSAMAKKYLGDTIDIHAGGQDLAFPHHENEIAQSEALNEQSFANYWMHNGYLKIDNEKMSKSLGNFILVNEMLKKHSPQVIRFFMLSVQYRHPINFSDELLESAKNGLDRIYNAYLNLEHRKESTTGFDGNDEQTQERMTQYISRFEEAMNDDFNTANAIAVLFDLTKETNLYLQNSHTSIETIESIQNVFNTITEVLGITLLQGEELLEEEINALIEERNQARKERNFQRADEIRDLLKDKNIILEDTPQGIRWKRGS